MHLSIEQLISRVRIIVFYGVGFGNVTPDIPAGRIVDQPNMLAANFQAYCPDVPATVKFAGLVNGFLGLYQFNVQVPNVPGGDAVAFTFTLGGIKGAQSLIVPIQN